MQRENTSNHVNAFTVTNGIPYLLGEYADNAIMRTIDRALIRDDIVVDMTESMRPVIDISIDTIGKNASDGLPSIIGNTSRYENLLQCVQNLKYQLDGKFPVIKSGIVIRVFYQLENNRTGQVIRSMVEDLKINHRTYFLDINKNDINNNAIITHFSDSMMSTVNQFTQGRDQMILRITSIQLCYDVVCNDTTTPRLQGDKPGASLASVYDKQYTGINNPVPPSWYIQDRFYHFDTNGNDIILHDQEIYDTRNKVLRIQCGQIQVNRYFAVNPGSRIVFKFSIWQNDVILVPNTIEIANALGIGAQPYYPPYTPPAPCPIKPHWDYDPNIEEMMHRVMKLTRQMQGMDRKQNEAVNQLSRAMKGLIKQIQDISGKEEPEPELPDELPTDKHGHRPCPPRPHHHGKSWEKIKEIENTISALQTQLEQVKEVAEDEAAEPNVIPMTYDDIMAAIAAADAEVDPEPPNGDF